MMEGQEMLRTGAKTSGDNVRVILAPVSYCVTDVTFFQEKVWTVFDCTPSCCWTDIEPLTPYPFIYLLECLCASVDTF